MSCTRLAALVATLVACSSPAFAQTFKPAPSGRATAGEIRFAWGIREFSAPWRVK
jgi:hypothetical protein